MKNWLRRAPTTSTLNLVAAVVVLLNVGACGGSGESSAQISREASSEIILSTPGAARIDPATLVLDGLLDVFNAQDAEGVAAVFDDPTRA